MATVSEKLLTVEEYAEMPDDGPPTELVRGRIIELSRPHFLQGLLCGVLSRILGNWVFDRKLGQIIMNDSGIITHRDPDSLRGADLAYYSFARIPRGSDPGNYPNVAPELVIEVRSPSERWSEIDAKVAEYLGIGVLVVCVIDPEPRTARLYYQDQPDRMVGPDGDLTFPECLPDFSVPMRSLFE
jgi:Uma2 family endonuclease